MAEAQRTSTLSLNPIHSNEFESLREELFDIKRIVMSNRNSKPAYPPRGPSRNKNQTLDSNFRCQRPQPPQRYVPWTNSWARSNSSLRQFDSHNNWQNSHKNSETNRFRPNRQETCPCRIHGSEVGLISGAGRIILNKPQTSHTICYENPESDEFIDE